MSHDGHAIAPRQREWIWTLGITLVVFVLLFSRAMTRTLDPDEHQFIAPALLYNLEHLRPYVDYPLFHTPLLVYIYAAILNVSDNALLVTRTFSALIGTLCVVSVYLTARAWMRNAPVREARNFGLCLVAIHITARVFTYTNGWSWNHDASICAMLLALLLHLHAVQRGHVRWFPLVGLLLGVAVSIRLTTAPAAGVLGLCGLFLASTLTPVKRVFAATLALIGAAIALLPTWRLYQASPDDFVFGNLGYPRLYKSYVLAGNTQHTTILGKIGHFFQTWMTDPGNLAALSLVVFALVRIVQTRSWRGLEGARVATLVAVSFALWIGLNTPFQPQMQYHSVLLPFFLLLIAATAASEISRADQLARWFKWAAIAGIAAAVINVPRWYPQVYKLAVPSSWTPMRVAKTSQWVKEMVPAGGRVLTIDPLIPLQAGVKVYPQYATGRFTFHVGQYMTEEERRARHIAWGPQLDELVQGDRPSAILYKTDFKKTAQQLADTAAQLGLLAHQSPDGEYTLWISAP